MNGLVQIGHRLSCNGCGKAWRFDEIGKQCAREHAAQNGHTLREERDYAFSPATAPDTLT